MKQVIYAVIILFFSTAAFADLPNGALSIEDMFKRYDTNNDGLVSKEEFLANSADPNKEAIFACADTHKKGQLTLEEFNTFPQCSNSIETNQKMNSIIKNALSHK